MGEMDWICEYAPLEIAPFNLNDRQKLLHGSHNFTAQYIDDFEELPFDIDVLRRHIERLIIVSSPLQEFILDIRKVYRWEDPWRTSKWLTLYLLLWYTSYIMSFVVREFWIWSIISDIISMHILSMQLQRTTIILRPWPRCARNFREILIGEPRLLKLGSLWASMETKTGLDPFWNNLVHIYNYRSRT